MERIFLYSLWWKTNSPGLTVALEIIGEYVHLNEKADQQSVKALLTTVTMVDDIFDIFDVFDP